MDSKGRVGKDRALAVAKEVGTDMSRLAKDMESTETRAMIEETMRIGDALKLQGTPAFIVGEEIIFGAVWHRASAGIGQRHAPVRQGELRLSVPARSDRNRPEFVADSPECRGNDARPC